MSEKEKMLSGLLYQAGDPELTADRIKARKLLKAYNLSDPEEIEERKGLLKKLIGKSGGNFWIEPPFQCDYGYNISVGDDVFINFNCLILDVVRVKLGIVCW
ncbi:maltose acetyltransferase domain-containing protein [Algoriphagus hitonicola]|uniref:maltose acetyltransferase domain-containing protein n=1 Tax=Algoriphagus hitonicola TaxID=435880 RepID=UPI00361C0A62